MVQVLAGSANRFWVGVRFHIWWWILISNKGEITHFVEDMDLEEGWSFTFDFDKFILISNLQTTDVSFMPRVAVWIALHAWLIHCFVLCIFPSHPKKQDKIQPLLQSTLRLSIHFECWEVSSYSCRLWHGSRGVILKNRKNLNKLLVYEALYL